MDLFDVENYGGSNQQVAERPHIGVLFECCGVYVRVYRNADEARYVARCPRCLATAVVRVAPGGSSHRIFVAKPT